jgi:hypothetical protein
MSKNTHAYHITFSGSSQSITEQFNGIHFDKELFGAGNETHGNKEMKSLKRQNWLVSDTLEGTVIHELGHAVHKALKPKIDKELQPYYKSLTGKEIVDGLSKYGKTSYDEFVAEAFAEYYNSDNPRPIAKKVGDVFESLSKIKN